jgi:gamma-glutamyl:cysteine ligase YbdK (ATP-grasp superfamily)
MPHLPPFSPPDGRHFSELSRRSPPQPHIITKEVRTMNTLRNLAVAAALLTALPAWACTPEEATAKREQLATEVTKLTEQNPTKAKEMNDELQKMDLDTESAEFPDKCQLIDARLKELKEAAAKAKN